MEKFVAELRKEGAFALAMGMLVYVLVFEGNEKAAMLTAQNEDLKSQRTQLMEIVNKNTEALSELNESVQRLQIAIARR